MTFTLDITLTPAGKGVYQAEGRDAEGTVVGQHAFHYRPDLLATHQQLKALEQGATLSGGDAAAPPALLAEAEAFGRDLYQRLFGGDLGRHWETLRSQAQAAGEGVRLRLRMAEDAPELDTLLWEFLHDGQTFLAPDRQVLLARGVAALPDFAIPETATGPLAVLVIVSNPLDLPDLQAFEPDEELAVIYQALDEQLRRGQVHIEVVDEASVREMRRALIARDYQVVHFIGHGNFDEQRGGYLVIEDEKGDATGLSGADFAKLLSGRGVRLVLLSSCLTAHGSPTQAYRSVAGALLRRGLPAVVAMQYPILITSARAFYRTVYEALAANRPLDVAVAEGQQALYLERGQVSLDWATPALFSRGAGAWRLGVDTLAGTGVREAVPPPPRVELSSLGGLEVMERGFVGRQREQRQIRRAFLRDEARAALIHGFGGIGKTVLATRVARRLAETERFDGVFGLRARPDLTADEILRAFNDFFKLHGIEAFDPVMRAPIPLAQKVDALTQVLRQVRLIVLFDNCEDWLTEEGGRHRLANPDLAALLAGLITALDQGSKLLLTSRYRFDPLPRGRLSGALLPVHLGELSRGEAIRMMGALPALRETDYGARLRVYQAVGGHPFVLNLFAERAARDGVDYVLADVGTVRREAEELGRLLLKQIVERLSDGAWRLLERASVLRRAAPREAWEALAGTHRIGEALEELMGWGLTTQARYRDELCYPEPETRYGMHTLVREHTEGRIANSEWRMALLAVAGCFEKRADETRYLQIDVFNRLEARHYYFQASEYQKAGEIDQAVIDPLLTWGLLDTARELNRQTAEHATGRVRAAALHHWGMVEQAQGNYAAAVRLYEQSLKTSEELGDKSGVASSLHQLGMIQQAQGNYAEAVRLYEQSLKTSEELGDKSGVASSLGQMGKLAQAQGRYKEAMSYYLRALALFQALNSPYAQLTARLLGEIKAAVGEAQFAAWWEELGAQ
jgi:tetratricopeptide (TPR) repeat protein